MERVFNDLGSAPDTSSDDDEGSYEARIRQMISDARSFEESELRVEREELDEYYYGLEPALIAEDDDEKDVSGRSTIVSTDVRDAVMAILPSLMRIFTGSENIVDFAPNAEQDVDAAKQATDYANHVFWEDNDGFLLTHSICKDALSRKIAIVTWWTDNDTEVSQKRFSGISEEQLQLMLQEEPDLELLDVRQGQDGTIDIAVKFVKSKPVIRIKAVPPDQFRVSPFAVDTENAPLIGYEAMMRKSDLVKMGYDKDMLNDYTGYTAPWSLEQDLRTPGQQGYQLDDGVVYGEYYVRIDSDGDGIDEIHKICTIGEDGATILSDTIEPRVRYAVFCGDPRAHALIGDCVADLVKDIQKIKTNMLRGSLDSLAQSIYPRTTVNELITNVEDALNQEIGAVVRTRGDVRSAIGYQVVPFVGDQVFGMMDKIDQLRQSRTGISEASKGVDPKALQSTNVMGIDAIVTGAQERIELIARLLAHVGFKHLFKGLLQEMVDHPNKERVLHMRGKWVAVNPSTFDADMKVKVNPTLGRGSDVIRLQALQGIKATQEMIMTKFGIKNPFVTPEHYRNTIADMANLVNVRDVSRFFAEITPDVLKQIMEAPEPPNPELMIAQAELEKVKAQTAKAIAEKQAEQEKLKVEDDFRRDKLDIDALLKAAEIIAKDNAKVTEQPVLQGHNTPPASPLLGGSQ